MESASEGVDDDDDDVEGEEEEEGEEERGEEEEVNSLDPIDRVCLDKVCKDLCILFD